MRVAVTLEQCWHRVPGGMATVALETVRALADEPDLDLVGVAARHRRPPPDDWSPGRWCPSVPIRQLGLPRRALYETWHTLRRPGVASATGPVDAIHATAMAMPPPDAPIVYTLHDLAFRHEPGWFTANGVRFFEQATELAMADASIVICPSEATRREGVAAGFAADRLRVVPLGTSGTAVGEERVRAVRAAYGLTRPYVLWTGSIEPRKNLRSLIAAFGRLDDTDLELVLVGPDGWHENLSALIEPMAGRVRTLGFVPRDVLDAIHAGARLFCFPSLCEGFGLPVLDAMVQATPVVTSTGTATEEVVGDGGLVVEPTDVDAMAEAMAAVLGDTALAERLGQAGRRRARTLTWERSAELVASAYREAAAA